MYENTEYIARAAIVKHAFQDQLNRKSLKYNWHDAEVTVLEGILARGDRKVGKLIEEVYCLGAIYDSWSDQFDNDKWMQAFENTGIDIGFYNLRERYEDEVFPWDFIDIGVTKKFLRKEWDKAMKGEVTPNCRMQCSGCGAARWEEVSVLKARIKFRKYGCMKFIGHLDVMRFFQKVMRRADIPIAFSGGYSPHMIMSFAQPLGIGLTSDGEYLDIELTEPIDSKEAVARMNAVSVEGIEMVSMVQISEEKKASGMTITAASDYQVFLLESGKSSDVRRKIPPEWKESWEKFLSQEQILVWKKTKKSEKEVDIKPMIYGSEIKEDYIYLYLATGSEQNLKPDLVMETFLKYIGQEDAPLFYNRLDVYARDEAGKLVPLEALGTPIVCS